MLLPRAAHARFFRAAQRADDEATQPLAPESERRRATRTALQEVAQLIGAEAELTGLDPLLAELAPEHGSGLVSEASGVPWIGVAFASGAHPALRIYVDGGWGGSRAQTARQGRFALHLRRAEAWGDLAVRFSPALAPLGFALTVAPGAPVRGTIYLRAFGVRLAEYVALARVASGDALAEGIHAFGSALLGADVSHPSASAVLSFGFGAEPRLLTELEFCAHCLYTDDVIAQAELERVFHASHLDATPYRNLARTLGSRATRPGRPRVHSFVGIDAKAASPVYTIYMKPDLAAPP